MKDYYKILEISENASEEVVHMAYKALVKKYHPDENNQSENSKDKMVELNEAYFVLSDQKRREQYDRLRKEENSSSEVHTEKENMEPVTQKEAHPNVENGYKKRWYYSYPVIILTFCSGILYPLSLILTILRFAQRKKQDKGYRIRTNIIFGIHIFCALSIVFALWTSKQEEKWNKEFNQYMLDGNYTEAAELLSKFEGYLQDYYCYYYPTSSKENKENNKILRGILKLEPEDGWCRATLKINTGSFSDCGEVNFKIYTGYAAIPAYGTTLNCIMYSDKLGEFCNLMFRYFKINFGKQDLRIAEVLSASSATENRRPTTHRMLLSREEIKDKDLQIILSALELNYSTITVVKDRLESVGEISDDYQKIVNKIISESEKKETYFLAESDVKNIAKKYMKTSIEIKEFIMQVRKVAYSYRYNKIGNKADTIVRDILLSKGYYKQENQV